jgi:hypothetical protein
VLDHVALSVPDKILLENNDLLGLADFERPQFSMIALEILYKVEFGNLQDEPILADHTNPGPVISNLDSVVA